MTGQVVRFAPRFRVEVVNDDAVFLLSERGNSLLRGRAYVRLAPLLVEGDRDADALVDALAGEVPAAELYYALGRLRERGHVIEGDVPADRAGWWGEIGVDPHDAEQRLAASSVAVVGVGDGIDTGPVIDRLQRVGVTTTTDHRAATLLVAITDDYLRPALADLNTAALTTDQPWLLARPGGRQLWLGPHLRPHHSACWTCLAHRLRANRDVERFLATRHTEGPTAHQPYPPPLDTVPAITTDAAATLITLEITKLLAAAASNVDDQLVTLDWVTLERTTHTLVRRPQCPTCGDPTTPTPTPPVLTADSKTRHADGGHRTTTAAQTWARLHHHISPITGAVSAVDDESLSDRLHVFRAGTNLAMPADTIGRLRGGLRSRSGGKGRSREQARTSALCEALERYSGRFDGTEPRRRASRRELGDDAIHPNACMGWSDAQYDRAAEWEALHPAAFNQVPTRFDESAPVDWSPVWSLSTGTVRYLPTGYCYYGVPDEHDPPVCRADSNGCAAGTTLTEAVLQGTLELVERDAVAMWWYSRARRPGVDLDSLADRYVDDLRAEYADLRRDVAVLDVTNDLGIPTFVGVSWRDDGGPEQIVLGFGSHLDARVAILRALTELNQIVATLGTDGDGSVGEDFAAEDRELLTWLRSATRADQPHLVPTGEARRVRDHPMLVGDDLAADVSRCRAILEAKGLDLFVLDQTRPDIGLAVARVIVPGLRHFWARFAPGRLYDVPVELGWIPRRLREDELNPVAMFL